MDKNGKDKTPSALLDYLERNGLNSNLDNTGTTPSSSIFEDIKNNEDE